MAYQPDTNICTESSKFSLLLDTGSNCCLFNQEIFDNHLSNIFRKKELANQKVISNFIGDTSTSIIKYYFEANLFILRSKIEIPNCKFSLINKLARNGILGMNLIVNRKINFQNFEPIISNETQIENLHQISHITSLPDNHKKDNLIATDDNIILPHSSSLIRIKSIPAACFSNHFVESKKLQAYSCLINPQLLNKNQISLSNISENTYILPKNSFIGYSISNYFLLSENTIELISNNLISVSDLKGKDKITHEKELEIWKKRREKLLSTIDLTKFIEDKVKLVQNDYQHDLQKRSLSIMRYFRELPRIPGFPRRLP